MSKATVKCPSCGKQVPAAMRYCGWCGFDMKVGTSKRVDALPRPEEKKQVPQPMQQPAQEPVQPVAPKQPAQPPKATKVQKPNPVQEPVPKQKAVNPNRMAAAKTPASAKKKNSGKTAAIFAALAVIVLVIVILAVLFRFQDSPTKSPAVSADFNNVHVVDASESASPTAENTTEPDATDAPTDATDAPAPVDETDTDADSDADAEEVDLVNDTVYVTGSGVNLRTGPGTTYEVIGSLARGTELKRTGTTNGWSRVVYNDETCYISSALISNEKPEITEEPAPEDEGTSTVVVIAKANIRTGPGTGYKSLGVLDVGTELESTGTSGKWTIVSYNGEEGYIFNTLIAGKGEKGTVTVIAKANIRAGAGTDYDILGVVNVGDVLPMNDHTSSNWYVVEFDGQTGYIAGNMVKAN